MSGSFCPKYVGGIVSSRNNPIYICLEGLDFSGKSTVFEGLVPLLEREGYRVHRLCPTKKGNPGHWTERAYRRLMGSMSPVAKFIRANRFFHSICRSVLFAYRSNYVAARVAADVDIILGDRSVITSYICRWTRHNSINRLLVYMVNLLEHRIPAPDHVLFFDVPLEELRRRRKQACDRTPDLDENDVRATEMCHAYNVLRTQPQLVKRLAGTQWHRIDAAAAPETVLEAVFVKVKDLYESQITWKGVDRK